MKRPNHRPPAYTDPDEMERLIDEYFEKGVRKKVMVVGKKPNQKKVEIPIPTITGLCLYLGFESRQSFYDYELKPNFTYIIKKARLFIEMTYEELLQHGNVVGAIFALKNMGWRDKTEHEVNQTNVQKLDYSKLSVQALKEIAALEQHNEDNDN